MAEAVYWAGRYLERAEDVARVVAVHGETVFDLPVGEEVDWRSLVTVAGTEEDFAAWLPTARPFPGPGSDTVESRVVRYVVTEPDNPSSVVSSLRSARENLRAAQPVVPGQAWEVANQLWLTLRDDAYPRDGSGRDGRSRALTAVVDGCQRLNGVLWGNMRRDEALAFLRIGQDLERVDVTARVLETQALALMMEPADPDDPYAEVRRLAVLRALAADQPFRRNGSVEAPAPAVLRFVLHDARFPRSAAACLADVGDLAKGLPRSGPVAAAVDEAAIVVADVPTGRLTVETLVEVARALQSSVAVVHEQIDATYFRPTPPPNRRRAVLQADIEPSGADPLLLPGARRYRVRHRTAYHYLARAEQSYNEAHLQPRDTLIQRCLDHRLEIEPEPSTWAVHRDQFANAVATFVVEGGFDELVVTAVSDVVVGPSPVPGTTLSWEAARHLIEADRLPSSRDARRYRSASRLVPVLPAFREYAGESFVAGRDVLDAVQDLCTRIHRDFRYEPGFTSITTPLAEVFEARRGVCQDFAHLAVACVRSVGLAARYVSGYLETVAPEGSPRLVGADASHAWFSIFLPGWGWLDLDPTNDLVVGQDHVTVAWGRDFWDVSPMRGTVEGGGGSHWLEVGVDVERLELVLPEG
jgi:transglutaminase-like putative cysteine protease/uncharacterized alpha-E superfamily protein